MRHAGGAQHQGHAERDLIDGALEVEPGFEKAPTEFAAGQRRSAAAQQVGDARLNAGVVDYGLEITGAAKTVALPHQEHHHQRCDHQQHSLDDLHIGGRDHAAEQYIAQHQHTDRDHRVFIVDADQGFDQHTAADHLRSEIEGRDGDGGQGHAGSDGTWIVSKGEDIAQRVTPDVATRLGYHQQHGDIGHQPAYRIHEAVIAIQRDEPGDAEKGSR